MSTAPTRSSPHPIASRRGRDLRSERLAMAVRSGLDDPTRGPSRRTALADRVDRWLADVWADAVAQLPRRGPPPGVALVAVGGHARRDAGPASDLDLVLLHDGSVRTGELAALADALWYPVWDAGLRLDHAVRSVAQCREVSSRDVGAAVGLLDLRPLEGNAELALSTRGELRTHWRRNATAGLPRLVRDLADRTRRHGELAYLIEGHLKEARGGLRDAVVLRALSASWLADGPHAAADDAQARLLDVRDALHVVTGRPGDRLTLADQDGVAVTLGLTDADALLAQVADAARVLAHAVDLTVRRAGGAAGSRRSGRRSGGRGGGRWAGRRLGDDLVEHDGEVCLGPDARPQADPVLALRAAAAAAREGLPLSPVTAAHLASAAAPLPVPWPDAAREALVELLGSGEALVPVWETLDQAGLVAAWLPEWQGVRNRPQRTPVHRHTVDRHQVQTCVVAASHLGEVARPDLLLLAALLHDIGKVRGGRDHCHEGAPVARRAVVRLGLSPADADVVERLVAEHLTLVELATRRDPDDPGTVQALAAAVGGRRDVLDLLRALTEADARAAGPTAWTPWRRRLVDDLVARTASALDGGPVPAAGPAPLTSGERSLMAEVRRDGDPRVVLTELDGLHAVCVVAPDRRGLFADIAGLLAAHGLGVRSASVRTVDGIAVDTWWVQPRGTVPPAAVLRTGLLRRLAGDTGVLDRLTDREARRSPPPGPVADPVVLLLPQASPDATVVEVRTTDRPGLLYALATALNEAEVDVRSAHVATSAGRVVDVLYLTGAGPGERGGTLAPARCAQVVAALVDAAREPGRLP